jgi:hypothetical protein
MMGSKRAFNPEGTKDMASRKQIQSITGMWAVLGIAAGLLFLGWQVASAETPEPQGPSPVIATATPAKVSPVPVAGFISRCQVPEASRTSDPANSGEDTSR